MFMNEQSLYSNNDRGQCDVPKKKKKLREAVRYSSDLQHGGL